MTYQRFSRHRGLALALAISASSACGGAPLNQAKLTQAQTALHVAETLGAEKDPKAKQMLQLARDGAAKAKRLADQGEGEQANLYLDRATADADLASQLMRTRSAKEKAEAAWAKSKAAGGEAGAPQ
jgi:hypothetical protein